MVKAYIVDYVSELNGKSVITLNKKIDWKHANSKYIILNGKKIKFSLTHSESIIVIDTTDFNIVGKEIFFSN